MSRRRKPRGKDRGSPERAEDALTLASHPQASEQIRRAKGIGGLLGLGVVAVVSWRGGAPLVTVAEYALAGGVLGLLVAWALMINIWRQMAVAEVARKRREAEEAYRAYLDEMNASDPGGRSAPAG
jgi:uncharacterized membrane protein YccC